MKKKKGLKILLIIHRLAVSGFMGTISSSSKQGCFQMKTADSEACGLLPISARTLVFFQRQLVFFFFFPPVKAQQRAAQTKFHSLTLLLGSRQ